MKVKYMRAQELSPELRQELLLQINENLAVEGIITEEMALRAKEKILESSAGSKDSSARGPLR